MENKNNKQYTDNNDFKIFSDEDVNVSYESIFDKNALVKTKKASASSKYSELVKEEKKKKDKRTKLLKLGVTFLGCLLGVFLLVAYIFQNIKDDRACIPIPNANSTIRSTNTAYCWTSETLSGVWIHTDGIYIDQTDPYLYGRVEIEDGLIADNLNKMIINGYVYCYDDEKTEDDLYVGKMKRNPDYPSEYTFEIHFEPEKLVPEAYLSFEINQVTLINNQKIKTPIRPHNVSGNVYIYDYYLIDRPVNYYAEYFSYKKNDYYLEYTDFGIYRTIVGIACPQEQDLSEKEIEKKIQKTEKMIAKSKLVVNGETISASSASRVTEKEDDGVYKFIIDYPTIMYWPNTDVQLIIGNTTFDLN